MTDVDSEVLRIQKMLYAQARENTDRRFKRTAIVLKLA